MSSAKMAEFDRLLEQLEKYLTLNATLTDKEGPQVKKKIAQAELLDYVGQIRNFLDKNHDDRALLQRMFDGSDRGARLQYILDSAELTEQGKADPRWNGNVSLGHRLDATLEKVEGTSETWESLAAKGRLKVGFGVAADKDLRNEILVEAGKAPEKIEEKEEESDDDEDEAPPAVMKVDVQHEAEEVEEEEAPKKKESPRDKEKKKESPRDDAKSKEAAKKEAEAKKKAQRPKGPFGPNGFAKEPRGTFSSILNNDLVLMRASTAQNTDAASTGKKFMSGLKNTFHVEDDDGVVAITNGPCHRFDQGYYVEIEVESLGNAVGGCMGLGITFMRPTDIVKMPRRLEKLKQGWFFSGPYKGTTRRLYRHGKKALRFILDGEETRPLRWSIGDKMSLLIRPKDWNAAKWQWTVSLYINRNIVLACNMEVPSNADGSIPKELELYACCEAFGYVTGVRLNRMGSPFGLQVAGLKRGGK